MPLISLSLSLSLEGGVSGQLMSYHLCAIVNYHHCRCVAVPISHSGHISSMIACCWQRRGGTKSIQALQSRHCCVPWREVKSLQWSPITVVTVLSTVMAVMHQYENENKICMFCKVRISFGIVWRYLLLKRVDRSCRTAFGSAVLLIKCVYCMYILHAHTLHYSACYLINISGLWNKYHSVFHQHLQQPWWWKGNTWILLLKAFVKSLLIMNSVVNYVMYGETNLCLLELKPFIRMARIKVSTAVCSVVW